MLLVDRQASTPQPPSTPSATSVSISLDNSRDGGLSPTFSAEITPPVEPFEDESGSNSSIHITPPLKQHDNLDNSRDGGMSLTFSNEITPPVEPFEDESGLPTASSINITPPLEQLDDVNPSYSPTFSNEITPPVEPFEDESGLPTASSINITPPLEQLDDVNPSYSSQRQKDQDNVTYFFEMVRFFFT